MIKMESVKSGEGFTIVELLVVMSIFVIVATMTLANYPGFKDRLAINREAETIASVVRQAQANGLAVKEFVPGSNIFPGYGVYFQISSHASYILFADTPLFYLGPGDFQYGDVGEKVSDEPIQSGIVISQLCLNQKLGIGSVCDLDTLAAVYLRPNPNVRLSGTKGSTQYIYPYDVQDIEVRIKSPRGLYKQIIIWQSGQVSIENCSSATTCP